MELENEKERQGLNSTSPLDLEAELRQALRRHEPPFGFTHRVVTAALPPPKIRWRRWTAAAALIAVALGLYAGFLADRRQLARQEEEAGRQVLLALDIAAEKLAVARAKVIADAVNEDPSADTPQVNQQGR